MTYTRKQILNMSVGRELDALVAEHVMEINLESIDGHDWFTKEDSDEVDTFYYSNGFHNGPLCKRCHYTYCVHCTSEIDEVCAIKPKRYSSDISAAWEVFNQFDMPELRKWFDEDEDVWYTCEIGTHHVIAQTAELAISKCSLLAVLNL